MKRLTEQPTGAFSKHLVNREEGVCGILCSLASRAFCGTTSIERKQKESILEGRLTDHGNCR
jgi:hypothetical protein